MTKRSGFTLFELLIAMSISGFIMVGIMQGVNSIQKSLLRARASLIFNKSVCLLFNQIERDLNTTFVPNKKKKTDTKEKKTDKKEQAENEEEKKPTDKKNQEKTIEEKQDKKEVKYFVGETYGDEFTKKIDGKKYELFKRISFINTNPMLFWAERKIRLVRVSYELVKNKKKSKNDNIIYDLFRKETTDIKNEILKASDFAESKKNKNEIITHLVATNIKEMFVAYFTPKEEQEQKKDNPDEEEETEIRSLTWGDQEKQTEKCPKYVEIILTLIDEFHESEETFQCTYPILTDEMLEEDTVFTTSERSDLKKPKEESTIGEIQEGKQDKSEERLVQT